MIPEQPNPQDEGGWTKVDQGWRRGLSRTLVGPNGVIREQTVFLSSNESIQQDILHGGNIVRTVTTDTTRPSSVLFAKMPETHIRIDDYKTKISLVIFDSPNKAGKIKKKIDIEKGIMEAAEYTFYSGKYYGVKASVVYSAGDIEFLSIDFEEDNSSHELVRTHKDMHRIPMAGITVFLEEKDQISFTTKDRGEFSSHGILEFFPASGDRKISHILRPFFRYMDGQSLEFRLQDIGDKFILEMTDTIAKKAIRVSAAKRVDSDSFSSIASAPELTGWEKVLEDADKCLSVEKDV